MTRAVALPNLAVGACGEDGADQEGLRGLSYRPVVSAGARAWGFIDHTRRVPRSGPGGGPGVDDAERVTCQVGGQTCAGVCRIAGVETASNGSGWEPAKVTAQWDEGKTGGSMATSTGLTGAGLAGSDG